MLSRFHAQPANIHPRIYFGLWVACCAISYLLLFSFSCFCFLFTIFGQMRSFYVYFEVCFTLTLIALCHVSHPSEELCSCRLVFLIPIKHDVNCIPQHACTQTCVLARISRLHTSSPLLNYIKFRGSQKHFLSYILNSIHLSAFRQTLTTSSTCILVSQSL